MILDMLRQHNKLATALVAFKDATVFKHPVVNVDTETLLCTYIVYCKVLSSPVQLQWMTTHTHADGSFEFVFCKQPSASRLLDLHKVSAPDGNSVYYCDTIELDYVAYFPTKESIISYEVVEALRNQKRVKPVKLG